MAIDRDSVQRVIDLLNASQAAEIEIEDESGSVRVLRRPVAPAPAAPVAAEAEALDGAAEEHGPGPLEAEQIPEDAAAGLSYVSAGLVGLFHRGRGPEEPPIVEVGENVSAGQVIGTIEALRKLTDVVAPVAGVLDEVLVDDGEAVQFGDRLFAIRREG